MARVERHQTVFTLQGDEPRSCGPLVSRSWAGEESDLPRRPGQAQRSSSQTTPI
jgi:hypothetical protein